MPHRLGTVASAMHTEAQLRLPGGAVTNSVLSAPDQATFTTADFEAAWYGCLDYLPPDGTDMSIFGQWSTVGNQRRWSMRVVTIAGVVQLRLWISLTGSTSISTPDGAAPLPLLAPNRYCGLRATRRQSDGLVRLYFSPTGDTTTPTWSKVGEVVMNAGSALFDSTAAMMIGGIGAAAGTSGHAYGWMRKATYRSGFDGTGAFVASPDPRLVSPAATSFTDGAGVVWTLGGMTDIAFAPIPPD